MSNPRAGKVADRVHEIIARRLEKGLRDPRLGFVTITDVRVTGDLQHASVFYTVLGDEQAQADSAAALKAATGMLRTEVGKQLGTRLTPSLEFIHDEFKSDGLVEECVDGRELYVGVLGNERLTALPAWEMDFGTLPQVQSAIATRRVKWDPAYQQRHGIATGPAREFAPGQQEALGRLAKRIYRALHMSGFARMDLRMRADGSVFVLEANANPNLTYGEDFAESAEAAGIGYEALIERIVRLGIAYRPEWRLFES